MRFGNEPPNTHRRTHTHRFRGEGESGKRQHKRSSVMHVDAFLLHKRFFLREKRTEDEKREEKNGFSVLLSLPDRIATLSCCAIDEQWS